MLDLANAVGMGVQSLDLVTGSNGHRGVDPLS
jgi:hypothetical protein